MVCYWDGAISLPTMMRWASSVPPACGFAAGTKAGGYAAVGGERQPQGAAVAGLDEIGSALDALDVPRTRTTSATPTARPRTIPAAPSQLRIALHVNLHQFAG